MKKKIGYYNYTVILTYLGMLFAFAGLLAVIVGNFDHSIFFLLMSGLCDMFDGAVASTKKDRTKSEKRFGIQIDSLSDLISFGVLPGVFVYCHLGNTVFSGIVAGVYVLCALIRLAYFNVLEEERQEVTDDKRHSYLGMPVTTSALLLPVVYLLHNMSIIENDIIFVIVTLAEAVCFVLPVEVKKPQKIGKAVIVGVGAILCVGMVFLLNGRI